MVCTVVYTSFLVRLWCQRSESLQAVPEAWHAQVEHVQTGAVWEFDDPEALLTFLLQQFTHPDQWGCSSHLSPRA